MLYNVTKVLQYELRISNSVSGTSAELLTYHSNSEVETTVTVELPAIRILLPPLPKSAIFWGSSNEKDAKFLSPNCRFPVITSCVLHNLK